MIASPSSSSRRLRATHCVAHAWPRTCSRWPIAATCRWRPALRRDCRAPSQCGALAGWAPRNAFSSYASRRSNAIESMAALVRARPAHSLLVLSLGPLTNLASFAARYPSLVARLGGVVAMAGSLDDAAAPEYNCAVDARSVCLRAGRLRRASTPWETRPSASAMARTESVFTPLSWNALLMNRPAYTLRPDVAVSRSRDAGALPGAFPLRVLSAAGYTNHSPCRRTSSGWTSRTASSAGGGAVDHYFSSFPGHNDARHVADNRAPGRSSSGSAPGRPSRSS